MTPTPRRQLRPLVLAWLREHANMVVTTSEVTAALDRDVSSVSAALCSLERTPHVNLVHPRRGEWIFYNNAARSLEDAAEAEPEPSPSVELYELVGTTKDGTRIVRNEDGILWGIHEI